MLVTISHSLCRDIAKLLVRLSLDTARERKALVQKIDLGTRGQRLKAQIDITGAKDAFCENLAHKFNEFGIADKGDHALYRLLKAVEEEGGVGHQQVVYSLLTRTREQVRDAELCQTLIERFDEGKLRALCLYLEIDWDSLTGIELDDRAKRLVQQLGCNNRIPDLVLALECGPTVEEEPDFPFTNREDEFDKILYSSDLSYIIVDAPAGYGKTHLLKELRKRFRKRDWACGYAFVERDQSLARLVKDLACDLVEVGIKADVDDTGRKLGAILARKIKNMCPDGFREKGLVILIDLEHNVSQQLVQELTQGFVPGMQSTLRNLIPSPFRQANRFRVILAGRYLSPRVPRSPLEFFYCGLAPFTYEVARDTAYKYLYPSEDPLDVQDETSKIAAHIIFLTGGHPQCIAYALTKYEEEGYDPDEFLVNVGSAIRDYVLNVANHVQQDAPPNMLDALKHLCVYRYFDTGILSTLKTNRSQFARFTDEHDLADQLKLTYLINSKRGILRDDITRRLLAIRLRNDIGQKAFAERCQRAQTIYADYLQKDTYAPERWVVEYLFQFLQQHYYYYEHTQDAKRRQELRQDFFDHRVPLILERLTEKHDPRREAEVLPEELEEDWEFRFMLNYVLREQDNYTDGPYKTLLRQIRGLGR